MVAKDTVIAELKLLVEQYEHQLLFFKRRQFGSSSEKIDIAGQISLYAGEEVVPPPELEEIKYTRKKQKGKREEDLSGLPVERIDYELSEAERACPTCGKTMREIGEQIRREMKLIPARVVVVEHAVHTYACRNCEKNGIEVPFAKAEAPVQLISGSLASPSLVAHIAVQKYLNGTPLYRLENGFRYDGASISRQTMANWVILCSERYLESIYGLLKQHLLEETVIHSDGTVVQVLQEPGRAATTKSCEWLYRTGNQAQQKISVYEYTETKSGEHPRAFLCDYEGLLHTDGYQVYHNLPPEITVVGCLAHVRRKFESILKNAGKNKAKSPGAEQAMGYISALFSLEKEFADLSPEERYGKRLEKSKPIFDAFFAWAVGLGALPESPLGKAVSYAFSQKKYLENIFLDGRCELTNNRCERGVKAFVMGRKAWLFSATPAGARASSIMYSIIETARDNGLHPFRYMEFLLERLPVSTTSDLEALLPWSDSLPDKVRIPEKIAIL